MLVGDTNFVADLDLPSVLDVTYVTSPIAHALIRSIDVAAAREMPGVVMVVTAGELDLPPVPPINPAFPAAMSRSILASDRVRFVGEPVVAIVAESAAQGEDAAAVVEID